MKLGVVVEGGAARTYFAVGVMDILMKEGIFPDLIVGSSAGIANAVSYASRQYGRSYQIGVHYSYHSRYMGWHHMLRPSNRCYYNIDFIFNQIPNNLLPFDYEAFKEHGCEALAAVTNVETGKAEYLRYTPDDAGNRALLASCALPFLFPPIKIDGKTYMDGGLADPIPYMKAIEEGCDKIIVITSREKYYEKRRESTSGLASIRYRKHPEFVKLIKNRGAIYNNCTTTLDILEEEGKVFVIRPESTFGWKRLEYDPDKIRKIYRRGYNNAKQVIEQIRKYISE